MPSWIPLFFRSGTNMDLDFARRLGHLPLSLSPPKRIEGFVDITTGKLARELVAVEKGQRGYKYRSTRAATIERRMETY